MDFVKIEYFQLFWDQKFGKIKSGFFGSLGLKMKVSTSDSAIFHNRIEFYTQFYIKCAKIYFVTACRSKDIAI